MADALPLPPDFAAIPAELSKHAQWLCWRLEQKAGEKKPRKMPYYANGKLRGWPKGRPRDGKATEAQPNVEQGAALDRAHLVTLAQAQAAYQSGKWSGIGFAFLPGDELIGIDIDAAVDPATGEINEAAAKMIKACDSWAEWSQSGTGVHIYLRGQTHTHKVDAKGGRIGLEIFCGSQFFVVTGRTWPGSPAYVRQAGDKLLAKLHAKVDDLRALAQPPKPRPAAAPAAPTAPAGDSFAQINAAALANLPAWCEQAVPGGRWTGNKYRVSSKTLGRDLEEDLAFDPRGIRDFGEEQGCTAIDVVCKYQGVKPKEALHWLAQRLGVPVLASPRRARQGSTPNKGPPGGGDEPPPGDPPPGDDDPELRFPFLTDKFKPRGIRENVYFALQCDPNLKGLVAFNEFNELHEKTRKAPWPAPAGEWRTIDDLHLANYLAHRHRLTVGSPEVIAQAVELASRDNPHHPLKDWLRSLKHDGVARLDHWLIDFVGAPDTPYTRAAGRMFLIGMVARVMRPGCKMDYALIFQGAQGAGKSSAFRALADPWFSDTPFKIGDKDALMAVQGVWLYEFSELDALAKSEETAIKAFITSVEDRFRPPYGTRMLNVPRRVVLCGTTNTEEFLRDATGGRRFWPVKVGKVELDGLKAMRDQLFAEAVALFDAGERWYPTREEEAQFFSPEQEHWKLVDVWTDFLRAYVNSNAMRDADEDGDSVPMHLRMANAERDFFSTQELIAKGLKIEAGRIDSAKQMQRRIAQCMNELGFAAHRQPDGKRKRGYLRAQPIDPTSTAASPPADAPSPPAGSPPTAPASAEDRARQALKDVRVAL